MTICQYDSMSYRTQQSLFTNKLKMTPQGYHRLSGSSRWTRPVGYFNILSTVIIHTYINATDVIMTQNHNFDLYKLSKIISLNTTTPSTVKTRTGTMNYATKLIYSSEMKTILQQMTKDDPDIMDNTLSRALIEPWQSNFEATSPEVEVTQRQENHKGPTSLLDETAILHLLVVKEGEPSYVPLSTNLGLNCKRRMLYFPMDFGHLTLDGLIDIGPTPVQYQKQTSGKYAYWPINP